MVVFLRGVYEKQIRQKVAEKYACRLRFNRPTCHIDDCDEYKEFIEEMDELRSKVRSGDLSDFEEFEE